MLLLQMIGLVSLICAIACVRPLCAQEFWLARPIDMDLARTRRLNRSLADQAMAAKQLQPLPLPQSV